MADRFRTRETQQRRVVLEALKSTKSHPTADWVFERVRSRLPKISLGTVYRNLSVLRDEGRIREVNGVDRRTRYDADMRPHAHFVCSSCGQVRDVAGAPEADWRTLKDLVGCDVTEQRLEFLGTCPACVRRRNRRSA